MTRSVSTKLEQHLKSETTSIATLWKLVREDGAIFGFTDHDEDIDYQGMTFKAATGYTPSSVDTGSDLSVDNLEVNSILSSDTITDDDLRAGKWDYCSILIMQVNYKDLDAGHLDVRKGRLGEVKTGRGMFTAELRGLTQNLQQTVGRIFTPLCNANFGDTRCKYAVQQVQGVVSVVSGRSSFVDYTRTEEDDFFAYGLVTFTSGANAGLSIEVKTYKGGQFVLQQSMPYILQEGDSYMVQPGCDKTLSKCKILNNVINFRGFPHLPGRDRLLSGKGGNS